MLHQLSQELPTFVLQFSKIISSLVLLKLHPTQSTSSPSRLVSFPFKTSSFYLFLDEQNTVSRPTKSSVSVGAAATHTLEVYDNKLILGNGSTFYNLTLGAAPSYPIKSAPAQTVQVAQSKARAAPETYEEQMRRHFQEKPFADITFKVQGTDIKAHKGFIAIRCPYFQRMFSSDF